MSEDAPDRTRIADCPACNGSGKIDLTIHVVKPGKNTTICGAPRPVSDRRRTTNPLRSNCKQCLDIVGKEEIARANPR